MSDRAMVTLLRQCGRKTRRVMLMGCSRPSDTSLQAVVKLCPELRHVEISRHGGRCADTCKWCTSQQDSSFTDAGLLALVRGCRHIDSLDASQCTQLSANALCGVALHCGTNLTRLNIGAINSSLTDHALHALAAHCGNLHSLDVYGGRFLTDDGIAKIATGCRKLHSLNIGMCHNLTNTSLQHLAGVSLALRRLEANGCNFDDDGLVQLTEPRVSANDSASSEPSSASASMPAYISPQLRPTLEDWQTPPPGICLGRATLVQLERLDVSECTYLTDAGITAIAKCFGSKLKGLNISYCYLLTDSSLSALTVHCPNLQVLTALECDNFTDSALKLLLGRCCATLRCVRLGSEQMTDAVMEYIAARCQDVETIDVAGNDQLTDFSVECVARSCTKLRKLHLPSWNRLTDKALLAVTSGCARLTSLDVSGCQHITQDALKHAAAKLGNLNTILCRYCPRVKCKFCYCKGCKKWVRSKTTNTDSEQNYLHTCLY